MRRLLPILLVLLLAGQAWAGSFDIFGTGARAIALGGAYTALGNDAAGVYYNIGAITQVHRLQAEIMYSYAQPELLINGVSQDIDQHRGSNAGAIIATKIFDHQVALGLNLFIPDDHAMRFLVLPIEQPHNPFTHNANHVFTVMGGVGVEVFDWLSVGGGVNVLATEYGSVEFTIKEKEPSEGSEVSKLKPNYAALAGVWTKPLPWLQAGFMFRDKVEMTLSLPNILTVPPIEVFDGSEVDLIRKTQMDIIAETNCHFSPRAYELGVAFLPTEQWVISMNLTYAEWSEMSSDAPYGVVYVSGGLADVFPTQPAPPPDDPGFDDTWTPSVGVEYLPIKNDAWEAAVRGGYRFRPTPVPEQKYINNYLDADTHVMSAGLGGKAFRLWKHLPDKLAVDGFFQYHYSQPRTYHKEFATSTIGDIEFEQSWYNIGASLTLGF